MIAGTNKHQKQIGIDGTDTLRYQAINSIIGLIGELLLMLVVDKIGRRKLVVGGNLAMCLTFIISTILLAEFPPDANNKGAHWGFIIMTWLYNFCFASMGSLCTISDFFYWSNSYMLCWNTALTVS